MIPNLQQVFDRARSLIGDTEVPGGGVWTNGALQEHFAVAYEALFDRMAQNDVRRVRRQSYYVLPAHTSYLSPATMGITNMGEPKQLFERNHGTAWAVSGATLGSGYVDLTTATHTLASGANIIVYGVGGLSDDVNDSWTITVPGSTSVRLNGCVATGTYTSGGAVANAPGDWPDTPLDLIGEIPNMPSPGDSLGYWAWIGDACRFYPRSSACQIKLLYLISATAPSDADASIGIDGSLNFLSHFTAGSALSAKGTSTEGAKLLARACGNGVGDLSGPTGGMLHQLLAPAIKAKQWERIQLPRFREKRNVGSFPRY